MTKGKVTVAESMRVRAAKWFKEKGYSTHPASTPSDTEMIEVMVVRQKQRKLLGWITGYPKRLKQVTCYSNHLQHVGNLWIECARIGASRDNWVFHVYGRKDFDNLCSLIGGLAEELKVDIHVRLEEEEPRSEEENFHQSSW